MKMTEEISSTPSTCSNKNQSTPTSPKSYVAMSPALYRKLTTAQNEDKFDDMQLSLYSKLKSELSKPDVLTGILCNKSAVALGNLLIFEGTLMKRKHRRR